MTCACSIPGSTLVIETVGYQAGILAQHPGMPHSNRLQTLMFAVLNTPSACKMPFSASARRYLPGAFAGPPMNRQASPPCAMRCFRAAIRGPTGLFIPQAVLLARQTVERLTLAPAGDAFELTIVSEDALHHTAPVTDTRTFEATEQVPREYNCTHPELGR